MSELEQASLLLVDDRPENLYVLENILSDLDCHLLKATSGQEALRLVLKHELALVLLDVQMPDINGFEVAELMRGNQETQEIPIIFVTAISREQKYVFKGYEVGAVDYLPKPLDPEILKSKVSVFLELYWQKKLLKEQTRELEQRMKALEDEITRRKKVEQELLQAKKTAEAATKAKSIFLAKMNHELRTPLNATIGYMSLSLSMLNDQVSPEYLKDLVNAERSANTVLQLINNVLDFSKIEAGQMEIFIEDIDLPDIIEDIVITAKGLLLNKLVELKSEIFSDLPLVESDYTKIKQILNNLVGNAIKFTTKGYVVIRAKPIENGSITRIEVEDTGGGIPEEKLPNIFESYKQVDSSIKKTFGGTGLGLTITKSLCEVLGIEIGVESEVGQGTMFWFHIPVHFHSNRFTEEVAITTAEREGPEPKELDFSQSAELADFHSILVVDDDETNLRLMEAFFKREGYTVYKAQSAEEAINIAIESIPDVVLMDLVMPQMDGLKATRILKQDLRTATIPVVACSAFATENLREQAFQVGCVGYIIRPVELQQLREQVRQFVLASKIQ